MSPILDDRPEIFMVATRIMRAAARVTVRIMAKNLWGLLAAALLGLGTYLAYLVSYTSRSDLPGEVPGLAFSITSDSKERPTLTLVGEGDRIAARFRLPIGPTHRVTVSTSDLAEFMPGRDKGPCSADSWTYDRGVTESHADADDNSSPGGYRISYSMDRPTGGIIAIRDTNVFVQQMPPYGPGRATLDLFCELELPPLHDTFADRKFDVMLLGIVPTTKSTTEIADAVAVSFSEISGISDLHLYASTPDGNSPEDVRILKWETSDTLPYVNAEWREVKRAQERDILLIVIGCLFALATACGIEWVRPWVEGLQHD